MASGAARRKPRENQFLFDLGLKGRKTGLTVPDTGIRDENGFEPLDYLFSSPEKTTTIRQASSVSKDRSAEGSGSIGESMDLSGGSGPEPLAVLAERRLSNIQLPIPRSYSPRKTFIATKESPARRNPSIGPPSSPVRGDIVTPARAVEHTYGNRLLDFSKDHALTAWKSPTKARLYSPIGKSMSAPPKRRSMAASVTHSQSPVPQRSSLPVTENVEEPEQAPDDQMSTLDEELQTMGVGSPGMLNMAEDDVPLDFGDADAEVDAAFLELDEGFPDIETNFPEPEEDIPQPTVELSADYSLPEIGDDNSQLASPKPPLPTVESAEPTPEPVARVAKPSPQRSKKRQRDDDEGKPVQKVPWKRPSLPAKRQRSIDPSVAVLPQPSREPSVSLPPLRQQGGKNTRHVPGSQAPLGTANAKRPTQREKANNPPSSPPEVKRGPPIPRNRGLFILRRQTPATLATQYSRPSHRSGVMYDDPRRNPTMYSRTSRYKSASPRKRHRSQPKRTPEPEYDDEIEAWEADPGRLQADVFRWNPADPAGMDAKLYEEQIAMASSAIHTVDVPGATFRFSKLLSMPFFGSGLVDLPPGGSKKTKNTKKMHLVFFVFSGRVQVMVNDTTFRIGRGGMFQVPRGNFYSLHNESDKPARIFFAQGCEEDIFVESDGEVAEEVLDDEVVEGESEED